MAGASIFKKVLGGETETERSGTGKTIARQSHGRGVKDQRAGRRGEKEERHRRRVIGRDKSMHATGP